MPNNLVISCGYHEMYYTGCAEAKWKAYRRNGHVTDITEQGANFQRTTTSKIITPEAELLK